MITHIIAIAFAITAVVGDKSVMVPPPARPVAQPAAPKELLPLPQSRQLTAALQLKRAIAGLTLYGNKSTEKDRDSELVAFCHNAYGRSLDDITFERRSKAEERQLDTAEFFDDQILQSPTEADENKWEAVRSLCESHAVVFIDPHAAWKAAVFCMVDGWVVGFRTRAYNSTFFYLGPIPKPTPAPSPAPRPCPSPGYNPYSPNGYRGSQYPWMR